MKTLENLVKAFIGESMARNRYTFYENEREHAETLLELIQKIRGDTRVVKTEAEFAWSVGTSTMGKNA